MQSPHNERVFHGFGLRRSGTHAICEWIVLHFNGLCCLNNSMQSAPPRKFKATHYWEDGVDMEWDKKEKIRFTEGVVPHLDKTVLFFTYEDFHKKQLPPEVAWPKMYTVSEKEFGTIGRQQHYNVLRSVYNMMASRIRVDERRKKATCGYEPRIHDFWKHDAKLYLEGFPTIVYDWWIKNPVYRRKIERDILDLPLDLSTRADLHMRTAIAHKHYGAMGSSFTAQDYDGRPLEMDLDRRWKHYPIDHPKWSQVLQDDELRDLNIRIFGWAVNKHGAFIS